MVQVVAAALAHLLHVYQKTIECAEVPYTISYTYGQLFPPSSSLSSVNGNSVTEDIK